MQDGTGPEEASIKFADDGTLLVFDGAEWAPYQPPVDDGYGAVFKGGLPPDAYPDDSASGHP